MSVDGVLEQGLKIQDINEVRINVPESVLPPELIPDEEDKSNIINYVKNEDLNVNIVHNAFDLNLINILSDDFIEYTINKIKNSKILGNKLFASDAWFAKVYDPSIYPDEFKNMNFLMKELGDENNSIDTLLKIKILHPELPQEFFDRRIFDKDIQNSIEKFINLKPVEIGDPVTTDLIPYLGKIRLVSPGKVNINMVPEEILENAIDICEYSLKDSKNMGFFIKNAPWIAVLRAKEINFTQNGDIKLESEIKNEIAENPLPNRRNF